MLNNVVLRVLHLPHFVKRSVVLFVDVVSCAVSTYLAFYLRLGEWVNPFNPDEWNVILVVEASILICLPIFTLSGLYRQIFRHTSWFALIALLRAMGLYAILFIAIFTFYGFDRIPRTIGFIQPLILLFMAGSSRAFAGFWLSRPYQRQLKIASIPHVMIYGAGEAGRDLAAALSQSYEMRVMGFLDDDPLLIGRVLSGKRIYNPLYLSDVAASFDIKMVLLAIPSANRSRRNEIIKLVQSARLPIRTLPSVSDLVNGRVTKNDLRDLDIDDLLGRESVLPHEELLVKNIQGKVVLVTGAGGSIGSELCRQIVELEPKAIILVDQSEFALYNIHQELQNKLNALKDSRTPVIPILGSVINSDLLRSIVMKWSPHIIYHAAAYKHVPLVESNIVEGVRNNVFGTLAMAQTAIECNVPNFLLISTDKAVRPTNVMGASKRMAEMVLQALSPISSGTKFSMVRFGNVLNSSGSVVPKFRQQIKSGGPVTVTDFRITRYFMTIPEAAQLVIQASSLTSGGDLFLLDMGEPVKILDLAKRMVELSGLEVKDSKNPDGDIEIKEIGLRPGEKLYEELLIDGVPEKTLHSRIFQSREDFLSWPDLQMKLNELSDSIGQNDPTKILNILKKTVIGFQSSI